jgi:polyisoprenoid-binding protein YceI
MLRPTAAVALTGALGLFLFTTSAIAQPQGPPPPPPAVSKNPTVAAAGAYKLDMAHTSVVARVPHGNGFSFSTFRFGTVAGTLSWDPAKIEDSKVDVTVDTNSIMTPVPGFAAELSGDMYLKSAAFPKAEFVSTSIQRTGPTKGLIVGNLTFMGKTKPMTIEAELVGAGKSMRGVPTVGFTGVAKMKRSDYGFSFLVPLIGDDIELVIDTEFNKTAG